MALSSPRASILYAILALVVLWPSTGVTSQNVGQADYYSINVRLQGGADVEGPLLIQLQPANSITSEVLQSQQVSPGLISEAAGCLFSNLSAGLYRVAVVDPASNFTIGNASAALTKEQPNAEVTLYLGMVRLTLGLMFPDGAFVSDAVVILEAADAKTGKLRITGSNTTNKFGRVSFEIYTGLMHRLNFVMTGRAAYNLKYRAPFLLEPIPAGVTERNLGYIPIQRNRFCNGPLNLNWNTGRYPLIQTVSGPSLTAQDDSFLVSAEPPQSSLYVPGTLCTWSLVPPNMRAMHLSLTQIDLGPNDMLLISSAESDGRQRILQQIQPTTSPGSFVTDIYVAKVIITLVASNLSSSYGSGFILNYETTFSVQVRNILLVMLLWVLAVISGSSIFAVLLFLWRRRHLNERDAVPAITGLIAEAVPAGLQQLPMVRACAPDGSFDEVLVTFRNGKTQRVSLPSKVFAKEEVGGGEEELEGCSICLSAYMSGDETRSLPCGHAFHAPCIDCWLRKDVTCPLCKQTIYAPEQEKLGSFGERHTSSMTRGVVEVQAPPPRRLNPDAGNSSEPSLIADNV